ncbi:Transposase [Azospirillum argentinense]
MRGSDKRSEGLFSYVSCEARVPANHPLRPKYVRFSAPCYWL